MSQEKPLKSEEPIDSVADASAPAQPSPPPGIVHEYTPSLVDILATLKSSLLISTYQAGKLAVCRVEGSKLAVSYPSFERPMGIAIAADRIAVATFSQIWFLPNSPGIAPSIRPAGAYDGSFLARACHVTGEIASHEIEWGQNELWIVNTLFSCICTLSPSYNFVPRWKPRFVTALAAEDRCHLNGMAMENGRPRFVTCLGESDTHDGWRPGKLNGGCLIDVSTGQIVLKGLYMPHSPRIHQGRIWLLESGRGRLLVANPGTGQVETVVQLPGYTRGLAFMGSYAFVGLSSIRETAATAGLPIADDLASVKCGIAVVDLTKGSVLGLLQWHSGIEEIFDVRLNVFSRSPFLSGPFSRIDGTHPVWVTPPARYDLS